jgi:hypothetical protein
MTYPIGKIKREILGAPHLHPFLPLFFDVAGERLIINISLFKNKKSTGFLKQENETICVRFPFVKNVGEMEKMRSITSFIFCFIFLYKVHFSNICTYFILPNGIFFMKPKLYKIYQLKYK